MVLDGSQSTRYESLYNQALERRQRLSKERTRKEQEELIECTFHPRRISDSTSMKLFPRPNSMGSKRNEVLSSLERLFPTKDQLNMKQVLHEENNKQKEQKEIEQ